MFMIINLTSIMAKLTFHIAITLIVLITMEISLNLVSNNYRHCPTDLTLYIHTQPLIQLDIRLSMRTMRKASCTRIFYKIWDILVNLCRIEREIWLINCMPSSIRIVRMKIAIKTETV